MQSLYETIDAGKIGLFESPTGEASLLKKTFCLISCQAGRSVRCDMQQSHTLSGLRAVGTGKTLSLICSSLQWLEDRHAIEAAEAQATESAAAGATCHSFPTACLVSCA